MLNNDLPGILPVKKLHYIFLNSASKTKTMYVIFWPEWYPTPSKEIIIKTLFGVIDYPTHQRK